MNPNPPPARARPVLLLGLAAGVVLADQMTKAIAVARLVPGVSRPALDGVLFWTLQRNPGAAFGIFRPFPVVFTIIAAGISIVIVAIARRPRDRVLAVALGFVLGGAAGNLVDRIARPPGLFQGHVVDFIDVRVWPVFNIADAAVVAGVALLILSTWRAERRAPSAEA